MPLQQGPFLLQPESAVATTPGVYDFEADAIDFAHELKGVSLGWNELLPVLEGLAADPLDDLQAIDVIGILGALETGSGAAEFPALDDAVAAYPLADQQLGQALSFAPAAAWADPPMPFVPPDRLLNLTTPTIPIDAFNPNTAGTIGGPPITTRPDVELENLTRFGAGNFVVGDMFKLLVLGFEGQVVTVSTTKNGTLLPTGSLGTIGASGDLVISGVMGPEFQGVWIYSVYLDERLIRTFSFIVTGSL